MEDDESTVVQRVLGGSLQQYLYDQLPLKKDFIIRLKNATLIDKNTAEELCALAHSGDRSCIHDLITFMWNFWDEATLNKFCTFLEKYGKGAKLGMVLVAAKIREKLKGEVNEPGPSGSKRSQLPSDDQYPQSKRPYSTTKDPTAPRAGMDEKIARSLDVLKKYREGLIDNMKSLGAVLDIKHQAKAILSRNGSIDDHLLDLYINEKCPTWRDFCTALNEHPCFNEVREKIEADHNSNNSLSEDTCIEQYKKALRDNAYVTVGIVKAMTIGPPRVGKTCLRSLLLGTVPPKNSPSTSVLKTAETVSIQDPIAAQKTIVSQCISTSGWEVVDTRSGIVSLLKYLQEGKHNSHGNSETSHSEKRSRYPSGSESKSPGDDLSQTPDTTYKAATQSLDSESLIPVDGRDGLTPDQKLFAEQIYQVISQSSEQPGVKLLEANLLQFLDSGGQISYHDILPVFITVPAIYFHVFNIMEDLDERPKDCIQLEDDEQYSVTSPLTTLEMISRSAITVHSLANKNIKLPCLVNAMSYPKPKMVIVGTHMDELLRHSNKDPEEEIKKNSKKLDLALSGLKFSIIKRKFNDKEQMFHPVNNYMYDSNPDTIDRQQKETIERLRKEIERIAADMKFKIPVPWYLQQLLLTKENDTKPFYKYSDLLGLCKNNGVVRSNSEFYTMISLFHNLGLVVHHDVGEEPKDEASHGDFSECLVFTNPSFLYENISRLYTVQFETCHGWKLSLKDQGLLQASVLPEIKVDESLTPKWFMDLLVTLFIGAEVKNSRNLKERTLFVPSVLLPNTQPSDPTNNVKLALMFETPSAFASHRDETYIPCGIFTGTIARLQSRDDWQVSRYDRISRSSITFQVVGHDGTYASVMLSDCTQYITFEILTGDVMENRCQDLRDVVFDDILESYKYLFEKDAQSVLVIGLPCSKTDHQNHIAPLRTTDKYSRFCVKCPYTRPTVTIDPSTHQVRSAEKELEDRELSIFLCISHPAVMKEFHTPAQKNTDGRVKKAVSEESSSGATIPTGSSQAKTLSNPCAASQKQVASSPRKSWKDEKPTEIQLRKHVCKHITGNYQEVCTYLGIPHAKIKGIRQDNQTSPIEQTAFECLLVWHSGNSEKHRPCWKVLFNACPQGC